MKNEHGLKMLNKSLAHGNPYLHSFCYMLTAMTHMIHGEMIISLIVMNKTLIEGYSNCVNGSLNKEIGGSGLPRFEKHIIFIENVVSKKILGDEFNPA